MYRVQTRGMATETEPSLTKNVKKANRETERKTKVSSRGQAPNLARIETNGRKVTYIAAMA